MLNLLDDRARAVLPVKLGGARNTAAPKAGPVSSAHPPAARACDTAVTLSGRCCGKASKLGEDVIETRKVASRGWENDRNRAEPFSYRNPKPSPSRLRRSILVSATGPGLVAVASDTSFG